MEIVTSWAQEAAEKTAERIAMNLLREGSSVEFVALCR